MAVSLLERDPRERNNVPQPCALAKSAVWLRKVMRGGMTLIPDAHPFCCAFLLHSYLANMQHLREYIIEKPHRVQNFAHACRCFDLSALPKTNKLLLRKYPLIRRTRNFSKMFLRAQRALEL